MLHTIQEAVILTGKSRRTIYDHCTAGRVSYSVGDDSRRYFETSELIRAYGPLRGSAHPEPMQTAQARTPSDSNAELIAELRALRLEVAELRQTMLLIEHRPDRPTPPEPAPPPVEQPPDPWSDLIASLRRH